MMLIAWLLSLLDVTGIEQRAVGSSLTVTVSTGEYFGETYIEPREDSAPLFVFFQGEPIKVRVRVSNLGSTPVGLRFKTKLENEMFSVQAARDGKRIELPVLFDTGQWRAPRAAARPFDLTEPPQLLPREGVDWLATIEGLLPVGRYRVRILPNAVDTDDRQLEPNSLTIEFEVRPPTGAEPEVARREALRHFRPEVPLELQEAERAVERLLKIHPTSYAAFLLRARIADARGDVPRANASYDRAAEILRQNEDGLFVKLKSRREREDTLATIESIRRSRKQGGGPR